MAELDTRLIQDLKNSWRNTNQATVGFLSQVATEQWQDKPFEPRFKSFAWEAACLARTRLCYSHALETGKLVFEDNLPDIPNKNVFEAETKAGMLDILAESSRDMLAFLENLSAYSQVKLVMLLLQHERIHHGKLLLYCSWLGLELPESFVKTWGADNFG